jgi:hypothetical protein
MAILFGLRLVIVSIEGDGLLSTAEVYSDKLIEEGY